ncbi:hypothetical protein ABFS82_12G007300 [Erythranthe guttata]|uniref:Uncharacterized protein n=1 Tax=Erythranthe guttata TaxID=4155 RepID=A0A022QC16_ERYGU|nr:PREDICTED: uncharacterized protein LOC105972899 [Erythranthe guttata]EYU24040.1 hypothetical protein MIMGU_mgv1a015797mg [Erythranthe guttata]|eukprot:XP_012853335.1 PREDICTED: uncharacterized protein LOC105972899 [Erythranthe guttata]
MPDFGDEFIIESYKVPWLIWIQLVITVLIIIILFFGFSIFASDTSSSSSTDSPSNSTAAAAAPPPNLIRPNSPRGRIKVEDRRVRVDGEISGVEVENQTGEESSSIKDITFFRQPNHPCNFIEQAKRAFLKCLGLNPAPDHEKED